ncbi:serine hydrolase [Olivibacter sp. SDN3]|uniref:serine hydrolase domain-containing protein n=1 Tax=Olivibacter sp. SDN3 TaxID=2764720 RepID=UPI0016512D16|nr:serine hydrolase [Olivibacter sp. SDN3]QNL51405.1 serine hydrolase [Olivibacter sp. SDN3]
MHLTKQLQLLFLFFLIGFSACAQTAQKEHIKNHIAQERESIQSTLILNNEQGIIPLKRLQEKRIASISFGFTYAAAFDNRLGQYAPISHFQCIPEMDNLKELADTLKYHNLLIVQISDDALANQAVLDFINNESIGKQLIICGFGSPLRLALLDDYDLPIVWSQDTSEIAAQHSASTIFGGIAINTRLRENISPHYTAGSGFSTVKTRLGYTLPENVGISSRNLSEPIDEIMREAIAEEATPGAVVMIVKNGQVIFEQSYGFHTYERKQPTLPTDIFDMASISKITSTTLAVMRLHEQQKIDLNQTMGHYLLKARGTNKNNVKLRDVMLHQAGFIPYIPFYKNLKPGDISRDSSVTHRVKLADGRYLRSNYYEQVMWPEMLQSPIKNAGTYVYSDISMYVMKEVVEQQSSEPIEKYVQEEFYAPLGMYKTGYRPRLRFAKEQLVPTERDISFRDTLLQGYVHDQGAAMANGVAGHAGIFSSANDLAIYAQMLLNRGTYGGEIYFSNAIVDEYTTKQSAVSRRGLGFDRWDPDISKAYPSKLASPATFGHTGYTGTCIWIDPEHQLAYIFLANRVHPTVTNKLLDLNIRSRIQDVIYEAIAKGL